MKIFTADDEAAEAALEAIPATADELAAVPAWATHTVPYSILQYIHTVSTPCIFPGV